MAYKIIGRNYADSSCSTTPTTFSILQSSIISTTSRCLPSSCHAVYSEYQQIICQPARGTLSGYIQYTSAAYSVTQIPLGVCNVGNSFSTAFAFVDAFVGGVSGALSTMWVASSTPSDPVTGSTISMTAIGYSTSSCTGTVVATVSFTNASYPALSYSKTAYIPPSGWLQNT